MAEYIKKAYSELFKLYPDAYKKDDDALKNFFRPTTDAGEQVVERMVDTFKALCGFADFETIPPKAEDMGKGQDMGETKSAVQLPSGITLTINIQLALPATGDASVYDKIFKALREHPLSAS